MNDRLAAVTIPMMTLTLLVGCGRGMNLPPMARVTGVVTLDGKPLPNGSVEFVTDDVDTPVFEEMATISTEGGGNLDAQLLERLKLGF